MLFPCSTQTKKRCSMKVGIALTKPLSVTGRKIDRD